MPYAEHTGIDSDALDDNVILWRYMPFDKFVWMLQNEALFFARGDRLGDPYEGSVPRGALQTMARARLDSWRNNMSEIDLENLMNQIQILGWMHDERPAPTTPGFENTWEDQRRRTTVNCWHKNTTESDAMWFRYAGTGNGLAIKSTVGQLRRCLGGDMNVYVGDVTYRDYRNLDPSNFPYRIPIKWMLSKDSSFAHEQEVRAICEDSIRFDGNVVDVQPWWSEQRSGHPVPVNLDVLVDEVVVSPMANEEFIGTVRRVLELNSLDKPVESSAASRRPEFFPTESAVQQRAREIWLRERGS